MDSRRAWTVFCIASFAYLVSVLQRASLGVAGLDAQQRFGVTAAVLSTLAVAQVMVYALLQVPVGVLLDRLGARALIIAGAILMSAGQFLLAFSSAFWMALVARILCGMGDAVTFNSVMRLTYSWFSPRRSPAVVQLVGTFGQTGQILSALPFALFLRWSGWTSSFVVLASTSVLAGVLVVVGVGDQPADRPIAHAGRMGLVLRRLRVSLARPGTWQGFWTHFVTMPGGTVIGLLWGLPFYERALGLPHAVAASMLMVPVLVAAVGGPVIGVITARRPQRRPALVLTCAIVIVGFWMLLVLWPGTPPLWFVIAHIVIVGVGGPVSVVAFDLARSANPGNSMGVANGVVNVGGFFASLLMILMVGVVLDIVASTSGSSVDESALYTLEGFRVAFGSMQIVEVIGIIMFAVTSRQTSRYARTHGRRVLPSVRVVRATKTDA